MLKHYYRLVYWKRRIARALGWHRPATAGRGTAAGTRGADRGAGSRTRRVRSRLARARPLLLFAVLVLIVVVASALLGWRDDTFGADHREGGATVRSTGGAGQGVVMVSCAPHGAVCAPGREGPGAG
ncbi:hypothetical protein ACFU90_30425 [Streptomyces noursei]|uniref:hypothetical protein n=1 Tax=Streptomyces noursei TaxID=1971 RepID=UPI00033D0A08|nr:hypothetical protein [Streptomyces noursei]AKA03647.1 hypothetical protein SAZ_15160 [Streptomyces noursei ZPM]EOT03442.1 hypothetical protein K530_13566 [Streptomyces noursei CCRC 11814]EXU85795.1 hypothetical protein P354_06655 [Streptomyces noursei PD-1]UWS72028.1 hypothetical protein N1H47_12650 [Streptomyces noursei]